jgi:hypothetical protein
LPGGVLATHLTCSLFDQLNYLPGYGNYFQSSAFMDAGQSGATDQLFNWLCNAPLVPIDLPASPKESQSGAQSLETGFFGNSGPTVKCPAGQDQPPAFNAPPNFFTYYNPETQNIKAPLWLLNEGPRATAAFINENWAEGEYYGVGAVAALQNGAGNFVQPTATSLAAAVSVAKNNADGTLTPDYAGTNADAYPMPDVIYAAVSANPVPASQAAAETAELTQMLALTGTGGSNAAQLPAGFVPMPASLVTQAQADIANDIVANTPPTTAVLIPSDGATQSGRAAHLDATASVDVTKVNFKLTGGPDKGKVVATGHLASNGWVGRWDTTNVPNGSYTMRSVAFYADGVKGTSAPITITVDNPPPNTAVVLPSNNAKVSGNQSLDATASSGVTQVAYQLSGGPSKLSDDVIATGTTTVDGWLATWNSTGVPNGTYTLRSVASYGGGVSGTSAPITIIVSN